ncbi:MAG: hypothetical protein AAFY99_09775 [Pseudomonadota bacterium]
MITLTILDSITLPGSKYKTNEDQLGHTAHCAFVIDGATGIGDDFIVSRHDSDAAWLATFAKVHFEEMLRPGRAMADIVRQTNTLARKIVSFAAQDEEIPDWNMPVAGFQALRIEGDDLYAHGLGDCMLYLAGSNGDIHEATGFADGDATEIKLATDAIARLGGLTSDQSALADEDTLAKDRAIRATYNKPGGIVWTLGAEPKAGDHLKSLRLRPTLPATGILATDGFSALVDKYACYKPNELIDVAKKKGLAALAQELRYIEEIEDPQGRKYPRMKQSDDATAILFEIT